MFSNYITIAFRNLRKNPLYTSLNIAGLAMGLAACLLITLYVVRELSYDRWNPQAEQTVRVVSHINFAGSLMNMAVVGAPVGPDAARELPEVQSWCRLRDRGSFLVRREGAQQSNLKEQAVLTVDSTFFEVFPVPLVQGDPHRCLSAPHTLAISRSRAEKYFGSTQMAIGQTMVLANDNHCQVTAVFEDMPENTHFRADLLLSLADDEEVKDSPPFWGSNNNFHTYLLLRKGTDKAAFAEKFERYCRDKFVITLQQMLGSTLNDFEKTGQFIHFELQNLPDIHLHSDLQFELAPNGSIRYISIFSAIAVFILLIACINFMNLATARSSMRAKEIGVRKAMGSRRSALIGQFLIESTLLAGLATSLAVLLATLAMPAYRELTGLELSMPWNEPVFWLTLLGGAVLVGLIAGSYPAFFLSAFNAVKILKGDAPGGARKKGGLRSALVVFQFSISITLILATMMVYRQLNFIQTKKLGFEKSQVIILDDADALGDRIYTLKAEMLRNPAIEAATVSGYLPVPSNRSDRGYLKKRSIEVGEIVEMQNWRIDNDYFKTLEMELSQGRFFDPTRTADSSGVVINETAAKLFGFDNPIGKKIYTLERTPQGVPDPKDYIEQEIIGVVKDFHWASLRDNIGALSFQLGKSKGLASFRYKGNNTQEVIAALEKNWKALAPDQPFSYRFLDEAFERVYRTEQRVGRLAGLFGLFSVFISCLGLFGLSAFTAEQRTKEMGVRKVLGASVVGIIGLLARDFLKLVLIAILIASPIAYYGMTLWLQDFAYRTQVQGWMFVLAGLGAVIIAFLTVSFQSVKAALANPVKSLRSE